MEQGQPDKMRQNSEFRIQSGLADLGLEKREEETESRIQNSMMPTRGEWGKKNSESRV
jgi:hypothetical protein